MYALRCPIHSSFMALIVPVITINSAPVMTPLLAVEYPTPSPLRSAILALLRNEINIDLNHLTRTSVDDLECHDRFLTFSGVMLDCFTICK